MTLPKARLTACAFLELIRYDVAIRIFKFERSRDRMRKLKPARRKFGPEIIREVCHAVELARCFYFKPGVCMQRSAVTVRMLRSHGVDARLVAAHRISPAMFHAWVEVEGRMVNDSPEFTRQLRTLWTA